MKGIIILLFSLLALFSANAQTVPTWLTQLPPRTNTYYYRVAQGTGLTEEAAQKQAFAAAIMESAFAVGVPIDLKKLEAMKGDNLLQEAARYVRIPINKVCQYTEHLVTRRGYKVYVLCQVANNAQVLPSFKSFNCLTNKEE